MTPEEFEKEINRHAAQITEAVNRTIPVKVGVAAEKFVKNNFRQGGFVNNGLQPWTPAKRIGKIKGARSQYKTLMSGRNHLFNSTGHRVEPATAIVYNDCEYADVHNSGLKAGRGAGFSMPKRQFIGESAELDKQVEQIIDTEISKIINL